MSGKIDGTPSSKMNMPTLSGDTLDNPGGFAPYPPNKPATTPGTKAPHMPGQINTGVGVGK